MRTSKVYAGLRALGLEQVQQLKLSVRVGELAKEEGQSKPGRG